MSSQKQILNTLHRIEASLWLLNGDERLKDLNRRLDIIQGNAEEQEKRIKCFEKYFKIEFVKEMRYKKSNATN